MREWRSRDEVSSIYAYQNLLAVYFLSDVVAKNGLDIYFVTHRASSSVRVGAAASFPR